MRPQPDPGPEFDPKGKNPPLKSKYFSGTVEGGNDGYFHGYYFPHEVPPDSPGQPGGLPRGQIRMEIMGPPQQYSTPLSTHQVNFAAPKVLFLQTEGPNPRAYPNEQSNIIGKQPPDWDPLLEDCFVGNTSVTGLPPRQRGRSSYESYTHTVLPQ